MNSHIKCKLCNVDVSGEKCIFAVYEKMIEGKEYYFCSEKHAKEFEEKHKKQN